MSRENMVCWCEMRVSFTSVSSYLLPKFLLKIVVKMRAVSKRDEVVLLLEAEMCVLNNLGNSSYISSLLVWFVILGFFVCFFFLSCNHAAI